GLPHAVSVIAGRGRRSEERARGALAVWAGCGFGSGVVGNAGSVDTLPAVVAARRGGMAADEAGVGALAWFWGMGCLAWRGWMHRWNSCNACLVTRHSVASSRRWWSTSAPAGMRWC